MAATTRPFRFLRWLLNNGAPIEMALLYFVMFSAMYVGWFGEDILKSETTESSS